MESTFDARSPSTILLLEDDPDFAAAVADALRAAQLRVLAAPHPWDAFRHLDGSEPIDLFLTDIRMPPGMPHGFAMARMARYRHPNLKLLFVTAYRDLAAAERERLGEILFKPIGPDRLAEEVQRALAGA